MRHGHTLSRDRRAPGPARPRESDEQARETRSRTARLALLCVRVGALAGPQLTAVAAQKIESVLVTNDDSQPVPTKTIGTTTVEGSVAITGTPTVNLGGQPIQVTTGPAPEPVHAHFTLAFSGTSFASDTYAVPAGQRLEIQFVNFHDLNRTAGVESLSIRTSLGGQSFVHYLETSLPRRRTARPRRSR